VSQGSSFYTGGEEESYPNGKLSGTRRMIAENSPFCDLT
jgi:hypothetical protein